MIVSTFLNLRFLHSKSSIQNLLFLLCSALWTGFTTCYAEHRIHQTVMVETGLLQLFLKCRLAAHRRSVALKKRRILA